MFWVATAEPRDTLPCFIALLCLLLVTRGVGYSSSLLDTNIRIKYNAVRRIMVENGEKDLSLVVDLELFPILSNVYWFSGFVGSIFNPFAWHMKRACRTRHLSTADMNLFRIHTYIHIFLFTFIDVYILFWPQTDILRHESCSKSRYLRRHITKENSYLIQRSTNNKNKTRVRQVLFAFYAHRLNRDQTIPENH